MDVKKTDWMESVRLVFDYFCERTPRSFVESREASIVWNYKCDCRWRELKSYMFRQNVLYGQTSHSICWSGIRR